MIDPILKIRGLDKYFGIGGGIFGKNTGTVHAVDHVSFDVIRGETFGIVGESGSGKTTLGRCIMRIIDPSSGSIEYAGLDREPLDLVTCPTVQLREIWRDIRMIFQDPQSSLNPRLPVIELVGQSLRKSENLTGKALAERVAELLQQVGLRPEIMHRYPGAFSGGQRQRLGIARALATNPQLVIADEAVSALDVSIQAQTLNLLQDLQDQFDLTYVFIAHDLAVVEHICDRIAVMYLGQIVELASRDELFRDPKHPYTRALLSAVPASDPRKRKRSQASSSSNTPDNSPLDGANNKSDDAISIDQSGVESACRYAPRCSYARSVCLNEKPPEVKLGDTTVQCHFAGEL